jgi:uncharacterized protein YjlB
MDDDVRARAVHLDQLEPITVGGGRWLPVRHALGVTGVGVAGWVAPAAGDELVEDHDERSSGAGGHEELYLVVRGRAVFTLDGDELDAPEGTLVLVPVGVRRHAIAREAGTLVLVVGARPGAALPVSPFEHWYLAQAPLQRGDPAEAARVAARGLPDWPDHPRLHYELACYQALAGERERALEHLAVAVAGDPRTRGWAAEDPDFDGLRDDPAFPAA